MWRRFAEAVIRSVRCAGSKFSYEELVAREKTSLDVFWLKDKSLTDLGYLPEPDELAEENIENLEAGLSWTMRSSAKICEFTS